MANGLRTWRYYAELRPDELADRLRDCPVAFWPLGLLEHHGWHLPVGFDGIKAERICIRVAERTGGVILPTMWWGGGGGHDPYCWTMYQDEAAYGAILTQTTRKLIQYGYKVVVVLAGHYPWQRTLDAHLPQIQASAPDVLLLWGTEMSICGDAVDAKGDHASKEETSYGLSLFPEWVDLSTLTDGRGDEVWPGGRRPPDDVLTSKAVADPSDPLFAQRGVDAREATAAHGEAVLTLLEAELTRRIQAHLAKSGGDSVG